ncbi:protein takeout-like [Euwallacea fornicatus]|uniref:protein takeout-like n=1 Tax=Euwallacea fornicatus TaxID=995702 RepID=UPI00338EE50B
MFLKYQCLVIVIFGVCVAVHLPPEIKVCLKSDPNFEECMKKSIGSTLKFLKDGNKELGFPIIEPFYVEKLELVADPKKSVKLSQQYEHIYMHGFTNSEVTKFNLNFGIPGKSACEWKMEIYTPISRMEANYKLTGQILLFPINGHGKCNVTLINLRNQHSAQCETYTKKGKTYLRLTRYTINMKADNCHFDFPNIIPGNEQISKEVGKIVNENSLEIFQDVKSGFEQMLSKLHKDAANNILTKFPEEELFGV